MTTPPGLSCSYHRGRVEPLAPLRCTQAGSPIGAGARYRSEEHTSELQSPGDLLDLHSFPTRRSSDLLLACLARTIAAESNRWHRFAAPKQVPRLVQVRDTDRKSTRLNSSHQATS